MIPAALALDEVGPVARGLLATAGFAERRAACASDRVVVCSPGFRDYLVERGVGSDRVETIYNWVDPDWIQPGSGSGNGRTHFLYAGNLGYSQGFETLVDAATSVGPQVQVEIVGDGNASEHVRRLAASVHNVSIAQPVPNDEYPQLLATADAHVVIQRAISGGANLPSKINTYLASGRPIVASIDPATPAAALLRESGGALVVPPDSPAELAAAMQRLAAEPELRERLGREGRAFAVDRLGKEGALTRLENALLG